MNLDRFIWKKDSKFMSKHSLNYNEYKHSVSQVSTHNLEQIRNASLKEAENWPLMVNLNKNYLFIWQMYGLDDHPVIQFSSVGLHIKREKGKKGNIHK